MPRIQKDEYRTRLARLRLEVARAGLDHFLVTSVDSIYYLTGAQFEPLERPFFLLVPPERTSEPALLVPRLDAAHMKKAGLGRLHSYSEFPAPRGSRWSDRLRNLVSGSSRIGVEPSLRRDIAEELSDLPIETISLVERLRLVKSSGEVAMIRQAAHYADRAVLQLLAASYRDASVAEGFARTGSLSRAVIGDLDDWQPLTTRVLMATWAAPRSAQPHSVPALEDRLRDGPHVALALLRVNGYAAESERTFFTVRPTPDMAGAFAAMQEARKIGFTMIRPGVPCGEVDAAVRAFLDAEGYGGEQVRLHRTGHGIGLGNHEAPWLAEGSDEVLAENMVISIEPGIYLDGEAAGGYRHSDTVLVTRDGHECLTRLPTELDSLLFCGWRPLERFRGSLIRRSLRLPSRHRAYPSRTA